MISNVNKLTQQQTLLVVVDNYEKVWKAFQNFS